ncbi:serine/threonine protein phosphatase [Dactylosporangium aurantiacum]|uniref:Serine/threonine protein phosphatase n=1 Tax=Dactylosporangium aurantiacum TaxID=35754 RepID=A0A9Q9I6C2_9ACTN|nr:serine/threonine protein phosphatase [Dactylosporangium aurantiacum]MDG6106526.1 serine/threonine protein phosphatase [Dactylosporangium aurantiacum]UWZ50444.1 serine/threonine protein phosphatase [Dactylosporangium aurantiacum]
MLPSRRARHDRVSAVLAASGDDELLAALRTAAAVGVGVGGGSAVLDVDGAPVFAKRIPITDRELAHPHSTANLFDLPLTCQYGMHRRGGPGFGAWRELAANRIVTEGVLAGATGAFAVLHHWRVLPGRPPVPDEHRDVDALVAQYGGAPQVRTRLEELARAGASLVLFLEHVPHALPGALDPAAAQTVERQLFEIVAFLRDVRLLHMDGHFGNMRAGDGRIHLVDFGLATSPRFDLSDAERGFVARHLGHDRDYAAARLVNWLVVSLGLATMDDEAHARDAVVRRCAAGDLPAGLPPAVAGVLRRHAAAAARMNDFHRRLWAGDPHARYQDR